MSTVMPLPDPVLSCFVARRRGLTLRACAIAAVLGLGAGPSARAAVPCAAFGLAAGAMQQDFLSGRTYAQAAADGLRLVGSTPAVNALIVQDLGRRIYTDPGSRARSPLQVQQQITAQCNAQNAPGAPGASAR